MSGSPFEGGLGDVKLKILHMSKYKIIPYNQNLKPLARILRRNGTMAEALLWIEIKNRSLGYEFHRQVPILNFIVDFYCHELKLAIEIDGSSHDHKYEKDRSRQSDLEALGVVFARFEEIEVRKNMGNVLRVIEHDIRIIEAGDGTVATE